jgi:hypothetical protein
MKELVRSAWQWLADSRLARCVADTLFRGKARRRIVELDHLSVARSQNRTLLGLVNKAHTTRFGREHDFRRIRNLNDFRRLVPLRTPSQLWREFWQPAYPNLAGTTWPGPIPYLAISASAKNGEFPYIPVSPELWATQQTAALTALAFVMHARPQTRLCSGQLFLLGGGTTLVPPPSLVQADSMEAIALRELPATLQPYAFASPALDSRTGGLIEDRYLQQLAVRSLPMPVTCLAGTADRLAKFFAHVKNASGRDRISDIWPRLSSVLYTRGTEEPDRDRLLDEVSNRAVLCLEMYFRPEGAVAIEDPRHGGLRLLPDHGVYFEFVPLDQIGKSRPARYSVHEVKVGVPYALAVSSPAGVWACLVGSVVRFEKTDPPLFRLVESGKFWDQFTPNAELLAPPTSLPRPHIRISEPRGRTLGQAPRVNLLVGTSLLSRDH